ncbi:hypothetical protein EDD68_10764 [Melghiribacillus thermohalophilus]|uniref:Restriction endonuclease type I HsdR N-terminal domain-containing protein n=2 Tax=Melghiribacillus thermohalophilus TaxID=1324956 RepID=A0A4R3N2M0_9BACI|nr:type I restriction endonuclease [Melghiribacillus thermohalophilus]TCT23350.1 hypothetical protein EDD68_10764 [Melghiribacillus thermohalophilus]
MEQFLERMKSLSKRLEEVKDTIVTEEATKTSIVMPFFQILGYDVFNPAEFIPEYTADVGIKKGEKVDYAIMSDGDPVILIEVKAINEKLERHDSQLFRYFGTTPAKFAILTNGITYRFYTDLEEQNKMDSSPFFEFNLLDLKDSHLQELAKFKKDSFDLEKIFNTASELKYTSKIKSLFYEFWENPSEDFVAFVLANVYPGRRTRNVIEEFTPLVKKSFKQFINELVNEKLQAALNSTSTNDEEETDKPQENDEPEVITTEEEIQGYAISKLILSEVVDEDRVFYRDNKSYFNILLDDNIRKWVCRLFLNNTNNKSIQFNDEDRTSYPIEKVSDIAKYKTKYHEVVKNLI